ncbi:Hypothetical_protein [Hexamita inflata]|uniref:Hypothetical_protein n=1 Tax=Hexamita inflata TaxID=28002 RepID=A0AA86QR11_9EUKA|nr:Hypothetical protein HINF_LOCUS50630 [Hexamita inflata]
MTFSVRITEQHQRKVNKQDMRAVKLSQILSLMGSICTNVIAYSIETNENIQNYNFSLQSDNWILSQLQLSGLTLFWTMKLLDLWISSFRVYIIYLQFSLIMNEQWAVSTILVKDVATFKLSKYILHYMQLNSHRFKTEYSRVLDNLILLIQLFLVLKLYQIIIHDLSTNTQYSIWTAHWILMNNKHNPDVKQMFQPSLLSTAVCNYCAAEYFLESGHYGNRIYEHNANRKLSQLQLQWEFLSIKDQCSTEHVIWVLTQTKLRLTNQKQDYICSIAHLIMIAYFIFLSDLRTHFVVYQFIQS